MIKQLPPKARKTLLNLYNHIWTTHKFPTTWKLGYIIPILKPQKSKTDANNYRPICLTNTQCKTFEKNDKQKAFVVYENSQNTK